MAGLVGQFLSNNNSTFIECFLYARHCFKHFTCIIAFNTQSNPIKMVLPSPFYERT